MNINRSGYYKWKNRKDKPNRYEQDRNLSTELLKEAHIHCTNIVRSMSRVGAPTDNPIIESLNGWIKEELYNDFGLYYSKDVPKFVESYIYYFNNQRFSVKCGRKSPVRFKTKQGF